MPPAKDKQGIENKYQNGFDNYTNGDDRAVSKFQRVSKGHAGSSSEHDFGSGHSNENLGILWRKEYEPESVYKCQSDTD